MARVLIVDADRQVREFARGALARHGLEVVLAGEAIEARRALAADGPFDLLLCEVDVAPLPPFALARELKADARHATAQLVLLTRRQGLDDKIAAYELGAALLIHKPVFLSEFVTRLRRLLQKSGSTRQTFAGQLAPGVLRDIVAAALSSGRRGRIEIVTALGRTGVLAFDAGRITEARFEESSEDDALSKAMRQSHGRFTIHYDN